MSTHDIIMYLKEIERLETNIIELQDLALSGSMDKVYDKAVQLVGENNDIVAKGILTRYINSLDTSLNKLELTFLQQQFAKAFKSSILEMANTEPLTIDNLPKNIKNRFTDENGAMFIINIFPKKDIWSDRSFLHRFNEEISQLSKKITIT